MENITISMFNLKKLLNEQRTLVSTSVKKSVHLFKEMENDAAKEEIDECVKMARYPDDIAVLEKYITK